MMTAHSFPLPLRIVGILPWKIFLFFTVFLNAALQLSLLYYPGYQLKGMAFCVLATMLLYLLYRFVFSSQYRHHRQLLRIVYASSWKVYLLAVALLLAGISCFHLFEYLPGWMSWSWTNQLFDIQGSIMLLPISVLNAHTGWSFNFLTLAFSGTLLLLLPEFAYLEEKTFRYNITHWLSIVYKSIVFGLLHFALAGVPLSVTMYLILLGFCFALYYRYHFWQARHESLSQDIAHHRALKMSTRLHTIHNAIIVLATTLYFLY